MSLIEPLEARIAPATFVVTNPADTGAGSLRAAIESANNAAGADTITFSGSGTIALLSALPAITGPLTIDGTSVPGFSGTPAIVLDGTSAGSGVSGLVINSGGVTVKSMAIMSFAADGILINGAAGGNFVLDCFIGTRTGIAQTGGNGGNGIRISQSPGNSVADNIIGNSGGDGVRVEGLNSAGTIITGNVIGHAGDGSQALANERGIFISEAPNNRIGGDADESNIISGNRDDGVLISGASATGNVVTANLIGLGIGGVAAGNGGSGIVLLASGNTIGGVDVNVIGNNTEAGIFVSSGSGNALRGNSLFANGGLGIDFAPVGPTGNDGDDSDPGPNGLQNFPQLTSAHVSVSQTTVIGSFTGAANRSIDLDFYSNDAAGEARFFLGTHTIDTGATGTTNFTAFLPVAPNGQRIVAIATDPGTNDSSEISASVLPTVDTPGILIDDVTVNETAGTATFTISLDAPTQNQVTVQYATLDGTALVGFDYAMKSGQVTFAPFDTSESITVSILDDALVEPRETFGVQLSDPTGGAIIDALGVGVIVSADTSLRIVNGGKTATWRDVDGDLVTLTATKGVLDPGDFAFLPLGTFGGEQLLALQIGDDNAPGLGLKFSARRDAAQKIGDSFVHVGHIDGSGLALGAVSVDGDLGQLSGASLKSLFARSLGRFGTDTQGGMGDIVTLVAGPVGSISIGGDVFGTIFVGSDQNPTAGTLKSLTIGGGMFGGSAAYSGSVIATGSIGSIKIAGSLFGGSAPLTGIFSNGTIGSLSIGGDVRGHSLDNPVDIFVLGTAQPTVKTAVALKSLTIGQSVDRANIRAGYDATGQPLNPNVQIGKVSVGGEWIASSLLAGVVATDQGLESIGGGNGIASRIASITVRGYIAGTPASFFPNDFFAFAARQIGAFKVGKASVALDRNAADALPIGSTGDVAIIEVS